MWCANFIILLAKTTNRQQANKLMSWGHYVLHLSTMIASIRSSLMHIRKSLRIYFSPLNVRSQDTLVTGKATATKHSLPSCLFGCCSQNWKMSSFRGSLCWFPRPRISAIMVDAEWGWSSELSTESWSLNSLSNGSSSSSTSFVVGWTCSLPGFNFSILVWVSMRLKFQLEIHYIW